MNRSEFLLALTLAVSSFLLGMVMMYAYDHPPTQTVTITVTLK